MKKILLIEDEVAYVKLLQDELSGKGYKLLHAKNGKKGLALAKSEHPELIILDIAMPEMDGMTMLNELRKDAYGKSVDVIILTNLEPDNDILQTVLINKPTYYLLKSNTQLADLTKKITELFTK